LTDWSGQEREAAYEREQKLVYVEKEKEVARLRALQERARDEQAERDAVRACRAQEQVRTSSISHHSVCSVITRNLRPPLSITHHSVCSGITAHDLTIQSCATVETRLASVYHTHVPRRTRAVDHSRFNSVWSLSCLITLA